MSLMRRALEEASDGVAVHEIEKVIYVRIEDFSVLDKAISKEHQAQWQIKVPRTEDNFGEGKIRIRKTIPNITDVDKTEYVITTKVKTKDGNIEVSVPTTEPNYRQFELICTDGMIKDRFEFPIEGTDLKWEVDCFYLLGAEVGSGKYCEWLKLDLETDKPITELPKLPFEVLEAITASEKDRTPEEETKVRSLYDNEFTSKNIHVGD